NSQLRANLNAYAYGKKVGLIRKSFSLAYAKEELERFDRLLFARPNYFDFSINPTVLTAVFPLTTSHHKTPGYCQALSEGISHMVAYHRYFNGSFPYETAHTQNLRHIDGVLEQSRSSCRIGPARFFWQNRDKVPHLSKAVSVTFDPVHKWVLETAARLPYTRRTVGMMLWTQARPVYKGYQGAGTSPE